MKPKKVYQLLLKKESLILDSMISKAAKKSPTLFEALLPILCLIVLLSLSVYIYGDDSSYGGNQIALIVCAGIASIIGIKNGYKCNQKSPKYTTGDLIN